MKACKCVCVCVRARARVHASVSEIEGDANQNLPTNRVLSTEEKMSSGRVSVEHTSLCAVYDIT